LRQSPQAGQRSNFGAVVFGGMDSWLRAKF